MAAAEALGRLNDLRAVYEILPRMRTTPSAMARRTFAAATGDLLGDPDGFYRILTQEDQSHGAGIMPLIQRLRADMHRLVATASDPSERQAEQLISDFDRQFETRDIRTAAATAFRLATILAERRHAVRNPGDIYAFLAALKKSDPRFAVGVWYLAVLDGAFERETNTLSLSAARELVEIQLAVYILASWAKDIR